MAAILDHVAGNQPGRTVVAVHADRNPQRHPLRGDVCGHGTRLRTFHHLTWYEQRDDMADARIGRVNVDEIPLPDNARVYLCGPVPFMQLIRAGLHRRGVANERIHYEVFGSEQWRPSPVTATA
jgi:nitric oxide dioxygenase